MEVNGMKLLPAAILSVAILATGACGTSAADGCRANRHALIAENQLLWDQYATRLADWNSGQETAAAYAVANALEPPTALAAAVARLGGGTSDPKPEEPELKPLPDCD